jgi:hypothetical protein
MQIEAAELAAALAEPDMNAYVLITKFSRMYARANDLDDRVAPHLAHLAFVLYNAGIIHGRQEALRHLEEATARAPKKGQRGHSKNT